MVLNNSEKTFCHKCMEMRPQCEENTSADQENINILSVRMSQLTFPYYTLKHSKYQDGYHEPRNRSLMRNRCLFSFINNPFRPSIFGKVYAADKEDTTRNGNEDDEQQTKHTKALETLAHAYIQQETGWERVKMIFEKDHRGKSNPELSYMEVAIVQVFVLTFFCKYIPVARFARKEFIREHQGTVFKTRFEAVRRLQDHTFMKAGGEAAAFSTKITFFSASFLFLSSMISAYRNKSSVLEYALAAGITGGLARVNMGLKGFISGSVVGSFLGSLVGIAGYLSLSAYGLTQQERHLEAVMAKLEVLKSIEGETRFRDRVNKVLAEDKALDATLRP